jgi:hypothetical protein
LLARQVRCPNVGFAELSNNLYNRKGYATVSRGFQTQHRSGTTKFWKISERMEIRPLQQQDDGNRLARSEGAAGLLLAIPDRSYQQFRTRLGTSKSNQAAGGD